MVRMGNTMLLATAVSSKEPRDLGFLPLSVDYQEKFAAAGKIPGGFLKREGRLSDREVLICRLVDRAIRPLFPKNYRHDTQINLQLISADEDALPDSLAALATSAALSVSDVPFAGPISEVRVALINGEFAINPGSEAIKQADLQLIVAATIDNILMVEGEMSEVSEETMLEALQVAHEAIKIQCQAQMELREQVGAAMREVEEEEKDEELEKKVFEATYDKFYAVFEKGIREKTERKEALTAIKDEYLAQFEAAEGEEAPEVDLGMVKQYLGAAEKKAARSLVLDKRIRLDGRKLDEIRPIWSEVDYLPSAHGSALFTRGETQSLTSVTLGTKLDEQMVDSAMYKGFNKFMLHYNFPAFSTGEVKPNRGPGRREIGHGNLAFRAITPVLPPIEENPYTIRVVSDILESNGSSSMATVCAGSLALMDAGVKVSNPVSGIAMGMISDPETGKYAILSDILGDEDHLGDMDFKVTGTANGITACQMDIKVDGLEYEVLKEALLQAKEGRTHILGEMAKTLEEPKSELKSHAPRSVIIEIAKDSIGAVIGPGGKVVQEIQASTGATIAIEEVENKGKVNIFAVDAKAMDAAVARIKGIIAEPEVGETYDGIVKSITPFGAFIEFMPGKEGLLHISEITWERLESMDGIMEAGEEVKVKLTEVDQRSGKFRLSRKVLLPKPEGFVERSGGGGRRGGNSGNRSGGNNRRR